MRNITLNKINAKKLGLLSAEEVIKTGGDEDIAFNPVSGATRTVADLKEREELGRSNYYKLARPADRGYEKFKALLRARAEKKEASEALRLAEAEYDRLATAMQNESVAGLRTRFVVLHHRTRGHVMEPESVELLNGCSLLDFGRRHDSLWISLIESPSLLHRNEYDGQFRTTDISHDYKHNGYDTCEPVEKTGYRSGEKFLESCSEVKVMGGVRQSVPLPTPEQKEAAEKDRTRRAAEERLAAEAKLEEAKNDGTRTSVFAYRGVIGILCGPKAEGVLTRPGKGGSFVTVVDAAYVDISSEALGLLRRVRRGSDSLGDIDVFKSDNGVVFGWMGGAQRLIEPAYSEGSREFNPSLLAPKRNVLVPDDFKTAVDGAKNKEKV
jgi:hypothetical protein